MSMETEAREMAPVSGVLDLQCALDDDDDCEALPERDRIERWFDAVLCADRRSSAQLTLRIVGAREMAQLNETYRQRSGVTNVLSFVCDCGDLLSPPLLGDIVICAPQVLIEATAQGKSSRDHWAHLFIHGCLYLLGYDHQEAAEAEAMEAMETRILAGFAIADPYRQALS